MGGRLTPTVDYEVTAMKYTIPGRNRETIIIEGDLLAEASSWEAGKQRWGEYRLYRLTQGAGYVLAGVGRSLVHGERDRPWFRICETPDAVIRALLYERRPGAWVLPPSGRQLLERAADFDAAIAQSDWQHS